MKRADAMRERRRWRHPDALDWMGDLAWSAHERMFRGKASERRDYANARARGHRAVDAWSIAKGRDVPGSAK